MCMNPFEVHPAIPCDGLVPRVRCFTVYFGRITFRKDFLSEAFPFFPQQSHSLFPLLFHFPLPSQFLIHPSLSNPQTDPISPPPLLPLRKPHLSPLASLSRRLPTSNASNPTLRHGTRHHGSQFIDLFPAIL